MATVNTTTTREWRDLDLNFKIHPIRKDINKHKAELAVINSIKNLISTRHYEVPFQPELGCNVQKLLFEPLDSVTATLIERESFISTLSRGIRTRCTSNSKSRIT